MLEAVPMKKISPPCMKVSTGFLLSTQHSALSTFKLDGRRVFNLSASHDATLFDSIFVMMRLKI
jgi:hypothetical protein